MKLRVKDRFIVKLEDKSLDYSYGVLGYCFERGLDIALKSRVKVIFND